jgi:DNA-binding IclR family transcriptional regulator
MSDNIKGGSARVGVVLLAVLRDGPIGLDALAAKSGVPRTAAWRALQALQDFRWVRKRRSDGAYQATARCVQALTEGKRRPRKFDSAPQGQEGDRR